MREEPPISRRQLAERLALAGVLAVAAAARFWFLTAGVPYAVGIDEPQVLDRSLRILHTGDWNTHLFDYPTLVIYLHAVIAIVRFMWGAAGGEWGSLDAFSIAAVYGAARAATAAIGVATVWLTWRLARDLSSRAVALLAAALLAVGPLHVRESHFALTDVPMTALTTLALWLASRAARLGSVSAYAWAGAACGLAAAAKYNGGIALAAVAAAWLMHERASPDRGRKAAAALAAAAAAFLLFAPYTLLDRPAFLDGFAAQFARFAHPSRAGEAPWRLYLKHLSPPRAPWTVPAALAGMAIVLWRRRTRAAWMPPIAFALIYFCVLSSHAPVFGRYALPLLPVLCLLVAAAVVEGVRAAARVLPPQRPAVVRLAWALVIAAALYPSVKTSVAWLGGQRRADTRGVAAAWLQANVPRGARLAVENSGPTYLTAAGFRVVGTELLVAHPLDWYRPRADYLVISASDVSQYDEYLGAGATVFQLPPTPQRWGPPLRIVKLGP